jgi:site-specific DNA-adenine methylase
VINLLPPHSTYIETHLGGGAVLRHKLPAKTTIGVDIDPAVIDLWQERFPDIALLVKGDALDFLEGHQFCIDDVVYCDPPYLPSTRRAKRVYRYEYDQRDHEQLLNVLCQLRCNVVISGYPSGLYDSYLKTWNRKTFTAKAHNGLREEKLWFNFAPPGKLHDPRFLGDDFRERQNIKRRFKRMQARLTVLPIQEQQAVLDWLRGQLPKDSNR